MKLYRAKVQEIATDIIKNLTESNSIEVTPQNFQESVRDLEAIMNEFLRRDSKISRDTKDRMNISSISYDQFGRERSKTAKRDRHPTGQDIEKYLSRQFIESFMISKFVDEVYATDSDMYKSILKILRSYHVDEGLIREEAAATIKNISKGTVEYEMAMSRAVRDVKRKKGLIE